MTNREAIDVVKVLKAVCEETFGEGEVEALQMAIDALEKHETTADTDTVSRQAVIDTVHKIILEFFSDEDGAMTDTEKTLLSVNKAVCNGVREMPSAQPETHEERTETHACDLISRQAAIDAVKWGITYARAINTYTGETKELFKVSNYALNEAVERLKKLPSAQPEIIRCEDCRWQKDQSGSTAWLPCRAIVTPSDFYCGRAERRTDERQT